ncbi:MAG: inositol monophosphatase [Acidobacteria bacterium]|nr:inositol monophosphatase [Acidobacteriota bacterium]
MASYLETAAGVAREAGAVLMNYFQRGVGFELKGAFDLVTEADKASEKLVVERLSSYFPSHSIAAEEGGGGEKPSEYRWYVDPLDGTTNFAHGFPMFNVTLALERSGQLIAGVIFDPLRDEMFAAERGSGSYCNNHRIRVSDAPRLEDSLLATGFPAFKRHLNLNVHFFHQVAMVTHGVRRGGSAALDLAYTACGRLDGFWEFGLKPWDQAAGILMVEEAGGRCSGMKGEPVDVHGKHLFASNGGIHSQALELFGEVFEGRYRVPLPQLNAG